MVNVYCDESCHCENDQHQIMVLGAVSCSQDKVREVSQQLQALRKKFGLPRSFELKWNKVSPSYTDFYVGVIDLFFEHESLSFRGLVVPNKAILRHEDFDQTHDKWYYKMYYLVLRPVIKKAARARVFLDIKDTRGGPKIRELETYLRTHLHDDKAEQLQGIQLVHSKEVGLVQVADLLIGALSYVHRDLSANSAKQAVVQRIRQRSGLTMKWSTAPGRRKIDVFVWEANHGED